MLLSYFDTLNKVGNFWFLYPLVLSKWEDLAFSVCIIFEESVIIFQFLNDKMPNYVLFNAFVRFIILKLKNKHTFLKTEKAKFPRWENLVFSVLRKVCLLLNFLILNFLVMFCLTKLCILSFKNWRIKTLFSKSLETENANSSPFDRTRGYRNQKVPTLEFQVYIFFVC